MISDFAGDRQLRQLCCYSLQAVPDDRIKVVAVRHVVVHTVGIDHVTMPYTTVRVQHLQQTISCHITRLRTAPLHVCTRPNNSFSLHNKTAELSQRRPHDAPNIWVPWEVLRVLTTHPATFPEICNGLLFRSILRMCVQNLKFVALPVPEIIGGTQKLWAVAGYVHAPFSPKILKGFC